MMRRRLLRWAGYVAVALVFAVVCVLLSQWQFARNEGRETQIRLVEENYDAPAVPLGDLLPAGTALDPEDEWRPVLLRGEYVPEGQLLVRNRPHGGTSAFEVLVPFRTDDGRTLIVNRGWVAPGEGEVPDVVPAAPTGPVEAVVRLRPQEPLPPSGRGAPEGQVPSINLGFVADLLKSEGLQDPSAPVDAGAYGALVSEDPAPSARPHGFDAPSEDPGPHLSYAIQWILFALMGFVFIGYIIRTEVVKHREEAEGRPAREPRRRRDRDMHDEDELLDAAGHR